jgi:hypothetical protein
MQFVPGLGKMGSGKIKFNGCFHDLPQGLQTHTYAPMNIDIRIKYRVDGNQPGIEPPQHMELGLADLGAPRDGLYLREDIEIRCNLTLAKYVKESLKTASKEMISRIIKKAELLDSGVLQAMIEDGKLKTINPNDRSQHGVLRSPSFTPDALGRNSTSPRPLSQQSQRQSAQMNNVMSPPLSPGPVPYQVPRASVSGAPSYQYNMLPPHLQQQQHSQQPVPQIAELPPQSPPSQSPGFIAELPGSVYDPQAQLQYQQQQQQQQQQHQAKQPGLSPDPNSASWRWSQSSNGGAFPNGQPSPSLGNSSRPTSMSSDTSASTAPGVASPGFGSFASELPTHNETQEEHSATAAAHYRRLSESQTKVGQNSYAAYNPADYARMH